MGQEFSVALPFSPRLQDDDGLEGGNPVKRTTPPLYPTTSNHDECKTQHHEATQHDANNSNLRRQSSGLVGCNFCKSLVSNDSNSSNNSTSRIGFEEQLLHPKSYHERLNETIADDAHHHCGDTLSHEQPITSETSASVVWSTPHYGIHDDTESQTPSSAASSHTDFMFHEVSHSCDHPWVTEVDDLTIDTGFRSRHSAHTPTKEKPRSVGSPVSTPITTDQQVFQILYQQCVLQYHLLMYHFPPPCEEFYESYLK